MQDFNNYHISEKVTETGLYEICRCSQDTGGESILTKRIKPNPASSLDKNALEREFNLLTRLDIKGVIKARELIRIEESEIELFEDFRGSPLETFDFRAGKNLVPFLRIAVSACRTLSVLHRTGIVHKEINAGSILYNEESFEVMFVSFLFASFLKSEFRSASNPDQIEGELAFISPEQTGRVNRPIDFRSDHYSLGVLLYKMLTGSTPFTTKDSMEMIHSHLARRPVPPRERNPLVPAVISEIIMRLLSKEADARYKSTEGILEDLTRCLDDTLAGREITPFEPGKNDRSPWLKFSEKLYGRQKEKDLLRTANDMTSAGNICISILSGEAGVGKSSLVREFQKESYNPESFFISGKFDQLKKGIPYSCLVEAMRDLIRQILILNEQDIERWKKRITARLGDNGQVLVNLVPELELVIGKQKPLPSLSFKEEQNRFTFIFCNFLKIFPDESVRLVLFLDDLQWSDNASLQLLQALLEEKDLSRLWLIGAYRQNEIEASHPLYRFLSALEEQSSRLQKIQIGMLKSAEIAQLLSESLGLPGDSINELTGIVEKKTGGNPFFIKLFLQKLYDEDLMRPDGNWLSVRKKILDLAVTENIARILVERIEKLPSDIRKMLQIAACIGTVFDPDILAATGNFSGEECFSLLVRAVDTGLIIKSDQAFKFSHDRVRESVYSSIQEHDRNNYHHRIGSICLERSDKLQTRDNIHSIVHLLNLASALVTKKDEKVLLARLNLQAALRAKQAAAYDAAWHYLNSGLSYLPENCWNEQYELSLDLHANAGEISFIIGDGERAEQLFQAVMKNARDILDAIQVYEKKIALATSVQKMEEAIATGIAALKSLGCSMPAKTSRSFIAKELVKIKFFMANRDPAELADLPVLTDPRELAIARILNSCTEPCYLGKPDFLPVIILKLINHSFRKGNSRYSPYAYAAYAILSCGYLNDFDQGYKFGQLALSLLEKFDAVEQRAKVYLLFGSGINHWKKSMKDDIDYLFLSYRCGLDNGDTPFALYAANAYMVRMFFLGNPLAAVESDMMKYYSVVETFKLPGAFEAYRMWLQMILTIKSLNGDPEKINGEFFKEDEILPRWRQAGDYNRLAVYSICRIILQFLNGSYPNAADTATNSEFYLEGSRSLPFVPQFNFYHALSLLAHGFTSASPLDRAQTKKIDAIIKKFEMWSGNSPENYSNQYLLLRAARLGLDRGPGDAVPEFNRAVSAAKQNGFLHEEAIANELAFLLLMRHADWQPLAQWYLAQAMTHYHQWGAESKVRSLAERYPLLQPQLALRKDFLPSPGSWIDSNSMVKVTQAISGEILLEKLLRRLLSIIIENAGAQRSVLLLEQEGSLQIIAQGSVEERIEVFESKTPPLSEHIPLSLIQYVRRTQEPVLLDYASRGGLFLFDSYIQSHQVKSVLCVPIVHHHEFKGAIYLENNLADHAFTLDRLEIIQHISTQAAISLENALLYSKTARAEEALQRQYEEIQSQYEEMEAINVELEKSSRELIQLNDDLAIFRRFAEASDHGLAMTSLDGTIIYANPAFCELIEVQGIDSIRDTGILSCFSIEHGSDEEYPSLPRILSRDRWTGEYTIRTTSGSLIPTFQNIFVINDSRQEPQYIAFILTNITRQKQDEQALRKSEERYRRLIETMKDGICVLDTEARITYVNQSLCSMLGYSLEEIIGQPMDRFLDSENTARFKRQLDLRKKHIFNSYDLEWISKDSKRVSTIISPQAIIDDEGHFAGSFGVITDVTEKKLLEEQLFQAHKMEAIGTLAGGIAHDFNNLLTAIIGYGEILASQLETDDERFSNVKELLKAADQSAALTRQLLAFSRRQMLQPSITNLNLVVHDMEKILSRIIGEDIELILDLQRDLPPINVDKNQFEQIILNISVNARDAMPHGGVLHIRTSSLCLDMEQCLSLPDSRPGNFVRLSFIDSGVGMTKEILASIFEPFFTTKEHGKGTGLGLAVVYGIIKQHEGWIMVKSEPGYGTAFHLYVPAVESSELPEFPLPAPQSIPSGRGEKIFVVEDQAEVRAFALKALTSHGYQVFSAATAKEAEEIFSAQKGDFRLLFCDMVLPDGTGINLIEKFTAVNPDLSIIVTSGYTDHKLQWPVIVQKGYRFLQKPYSLSGLLQTIDELLHKDEDE